MNNEFTIQQTNDRLHLDELEEPVTALHGDLDAIDQPSSTIIGAIIAVIILA